MKKEALLFPLRNYILSCRVKATHNIGLSVHPFRICQQNRPCLFPNPEVIVQKKSQTNLKTVTVNIYDSNVFCLKMYKISKE